jgi:hypothetical protein
VFQNIVDRHLVGLLEGGLATMRVSIHVNIKEKNRMSMARVGFEPTVAVSINLREHCDWGIALYRPTEMVVKFHKKNLLENADVLVSYAINMESLQMIGQISHKLKTSNIYILDTDMRVKYSAHPVHFYQYDRKRMSRGVQQLYSACSSDLQTFAFKTCLSIYVLRHLNVVTSLRI